MFKTIENAEVENTSKNTDMYENMTNGKMHRNCLELEVLECICF